MLYSGDEVKARIDTDSTVEDILIEYDLEVEETKEESTILTPPKAALDNDSSSV